MIERIENVGAESEAPILLTGPTGAGKSRLARLIYELRKKRRLVKGDFVEVNCATLRGDGTSRFANNKWGLFPSVAVSYNFGKERFIADSGAVSALKLRLSWGQTGQQDLQSGDYPSSRGSGPSKRGWRQPPVSQRPRVVGKW